MITIDFLYYKDTYRGNLNEESFNKFLDKAYIIIDNLCYNRFSKASETDYTEFDLKKVKFCVCSVIDKLNNITDEDGVVQSGNKSHETVGPWSVTYDTSKLSGSALSNIRATVYSYLGGTSLMVSWC